MLKCLVIGIGRCHIRQKLSDTLGVAHRTVLVLDEQVAQAPNLFMQRGYLTIERVVFGAVHFHFSLKIRQPLLLALATFQGSNTTTLLV